MEQLICFGDSNTYGCDPRGYLGGRYGPAQRWTGLLEAEGFPVSNLGQNGLTIPSPDEARRLAARFVPPFPLHTLTVMLGTNDLLRDPSLTAEDVAVRMARFLSAAAETLPPEKLMLIAPVPMLSGAWVTDPRLLRESARLGACYATAAAALGVRFADAGTWGVELGFDGVHFTQAGHAAFAAGLIDMLRGSGCAPASICRDPDQITKRNGLCLVGMIPSCEELRAPGKAAVDVVDGKPAAKGSQDSL